MSINYAQLIKDIRTIHASEGNGAYLGASKRVGSTDGIITLDMHGVYDVQTRCYSINAINNGKLGLTPALAMYSELLQQIYDASKA